MDDIATSANGQDLVFTLESYLVDLRAKVNDLMAVPQQSDAYEECINKLDGFVKKGEWLVGMSTDTSTTSFSLDDLYARLYDDVLQQMTAATSPIMAEAGAVRNSLEGLRDYLTLVQTSRALADEGYATESALRVYRQNSPNLAGRTTVYRYTQDSGTSRSSITRRISRQRRPVWRPHRSLSGRERCGASRTGHLDAGRGQRSDQRSQHPQHHIDPGEYAAIHTYVNSRGEQLEGS